MSHHIPRAAFGGVPVRGSIFTDTQGIVPDGEPGDRYFVVKVERHFVLVRPVDDPVSDDFLEVFYRKGHEEPGSEAWETWPPPGFEQSTSPSVTRTPQITAMVIGSKAGAEFDRLMSKLSQLQIVVPYHAPASTGVPTSVPPGVQLILYFTDMADRHQKAGSLPLARAAGVKLIPVTRKGLQSKVAQAIERLGVQPVVREIVEAIPDVQDLSGVPVPAGVRYGESSGAQRWVWDGTRWSWGDAQRILPGPGIIDAEWSQISVEPPQIESGPDRGGLVVAGALAAIAILAYGSS